ncbi:MAG TPA: hypothetical protein VN944_03350 [Nitrospiria bacterium]|nr:hypothetical protein [Nitrospiria bacterium]
MVKKLFKILFLLLVFSTPALARELEEFSPSINSEGFSGDFFNQSARVIPFGHLAVGAYGIYSEDSQTYASLAQTNATATLGLLPNLEIGGYIPYMQGSGTGTGVGDAHVGMKLLFSDQEVEAMPALALSLVGILPTGSSSYKTVGTLSYQGMLIADTRIETIDYSFYLSAQAGLFWGTDPSNNRERHFVYGGGAFLPLNDRLVFMAEFDGVGADENNADWVRFSGTLKYVARFFQIQAGIDKYVPVGVNSLTNNTIGAHGGVSLTF